MIDKDSEHWKALVSLNKCKQHMNGQCLVLEAEIIRIDLALDSPVLKSDRDRIAIKALVRDKARLERDRRGVRALLLDADNVLQKHKKLADIHHRAEFPTSDNKQP